MKAAAVILIKEHQVLLVKAKNSSRQLNGTVAFPGGGVEENETTKEAAIRELKEETGLSVRDLLEFPGNQVSYTVTLKDGVRDVILKVYLAKEYSGDLTATDETEPFWSDIQEARKMPMLGKNNQMLEEAIKFLKLEK